MNILRNIAEHQHERVNGRGCLPRLPAKVIPLQARIIAVANVFDALTNRRPYKEAWSNDRTFAVPEHLAGETLDADCVQALRGNHK